MGRLKPKQDPLAFIKHFQNDGTIDVFMNGCCYWFAFILYSRFIGAGAEIWYNEVTGHFATKICEKLYDIRGEIDSTEDGWIAFDEYRVEEPAYTRVLARDCILKDPSLEI